MVDGSHDAGASGIRADERPQVVQEEVHKVQEDSLGIGIHRVLGQPLSHRRSVRQDNG